MSDLFRNLRTKGMARFHELEKVTDSILAEGAAEMTATAKRRCVDSAVAATIVTVGPVSDRHGRRTAMSIAGDASTVAESENGRRYQRARMIEFGTRFQAAQPFMRPAYRYTIAKVRRKLAAARREFVKQLFEG